jgi:putative mRNA 3-end processing factor
VRPISVTGVDVAFHPAGHVIGSAQIAVERNGLRIVASGDYKRRADPTCLPFEPVRCDVFITEATFGLPVFRHPDPADEIARLLTSVHQFPERATWSGPIRSARRSASSACCATPATTGPSTSTARSQSCANITRRQGVALGPLAPATDDSAKDQFAGAIIVGPPAASPTAGRGGFPILFPAFASGWMRIRQRARQRGVELPLILSDHPTGTS